MAKKVESPTKVMGGAKTKLDQRQINAIEKRLALSGGSLLVELGAELSNRFGTWQKLMEKANDMLSNASVFSDGVLNKEATAKMTREGRELKEIAKAQRVKESSGFTKAAEDYLIAEYGEKKRDELGRMAFYGDRIEVKKNGHLRKIW